MIAAVRSFPALLLVVAATACLRNPPALWPTTSVERRWEITLDAAFRAAGDGRYGDADRTILEFQGANTETSVALEGLYWRALLQLHPANKSGSTKAAIELLDRYIASGDQRPHYRDATVLRHIASAAASPRDSVAVSSAAENERLKAELAKTQEELERIKRRLAQPRP